VRRPYYGAATNTALLRVRAGRIPRRIDANDPMEGDIPREGKEGGFPAYFRSSHPSADSSSAVSTAPPAAPRTVLWLSATNR
jgi:hypothetical protein